MKSSAKKIIAKTYEGKEYIYSKVWSFTVSKRSCKIICDIMNKNNWKLKPCEKWFIYDIYDYDLWFINAHNQRLTIRNGLVVAHNVPDPA